MADNSSFQHTHTQNYVYVPFGNKRILVFNHYWRSCDQHPILSIHSLIQSHLKTTSDCVQFSLITENLLEFLPLVVPQDVATGQQRLLFIKIIRLVPEKQTATQFVFSLKPSYSITRQGKNRGDDYVPLRLNSRPET